MPPRSPYLFPEGAQIGFDNVVLHARAKRHTVSDFAGPLSIKTVVAGEVAWIVGGRELVVDPSSFLILSAGERYSMNIDAPAAVETCCAFFTPGFVERVALDLTSPIEFALDFRTDADPQRTAPALPYLSALHRDPEREIVNRVHTLARRCRHALAPSAAEEDFLLAAAELLRFYREIREQSSRLPAVRKSTRDELFRRVLRGRESIHFHASDSVSLV